MEGDDAYALVDMDARQPWYLALSCVGRHMPLECRGRSHAGASTLIWLFINPALGQRLSCSDWFYDGSGSNRWDREPLPLPLRLHAR